jgi:hypothetical protein
MALMRFTRNHEDLSSDRGYQFRFLCDKCGNGHETKFVASKVGVAGSALRAAGSFFGGILGHASSSAQELQRLAQGKGHDDAFEAAVAEARGWFKQCSRCGQWVCPDVCWNAKRGLCEGCAPDLEEAIASAQAEVQVQQARLRMEQSDMLKGVDVLSEMTVRCPTCDAAVKGGKFCPECGAKIQARTQCASCNAALAPGAKFCAECGAKSGG